MSGGFQNHLHALYGLPGGFVSGSFVHGNPLVIYETRKTKKTRKTEEKAEQILADTSLLYEALAVDVAKREDVNKLLKQLKKRQKTDREILLLLQFMFSEDD